MVGLNSVDTATVKFETDDSPSCQMPVFDPVWFVRGLPKPSSSVRLVV